MRILWLVLVPLVGVSWLSFTSETNYSNAETCQSGESSGELIDQLTKQINQLRYKNILLDGDNEQLNWQRYALRNTISELESEKYGLLGGIATADAKIADRDAMIASADALIKDRNKLFEEIKTRNAALDNSGAVVRVFTGFESERLDRSATGIAVNMGNLGDKLVIPRHVLYSNSKVIMAVNPRDKNKLEALSSETMIEFPELDLAVLDLPASFQISSLPVFIDHNFLSERVVQHLYHDNGFDDLSVRSRPVIITQAFPNKVYSAFISERPNLEVQNFIAVDDRIVRGDSGSPLLIKDNGTTKVVAIVILAENITGGGIAVRMDALLNKLQERADAALQK